MTSPLLMTWYGDDLTGSTDVMEALALSGIEAVLFLDIPDPDQRARFPGVRALGIAGTSRSETPEWMDANLPPAFAARGRRHDRATATNLGSSSSAMAAN